MMDAQGAWNFEMVVKNYFANRRMNDVTWTL